MVKLANYLNTPKVYISTYPLYFSTLYNETRLKFWTSIFKKHSTLSRLYQNKEASEQKIFGTNIRMLEGNDINSFVSNTFKFGCSYINNFLSSEELNIVLKDAKKMISKKPRMKNNGTGVKTIAVALSDETLDIFNKKISKIHKLIFGKSFHLDQIFYQKHIKKSRDTNDPNTILHIDRFIPSIKIFYFTKAVNIDQGPFGFVPFSHLISERYKCNVLKKFKSIYTNNKYTPFAIENPTKNDEIPIVVNKNTLVAAFTNGLHRRIPFQNNNHHLSRESIRLIYYNKKIY